VTVTVAVTVNAKRRMYVTYTYTWVYIIAVATRMRQGHAPVSSIESAMVGEAEDIAEMQQAVAVILRPLSIVPNTVVDRFVSSEVTICLPIFSCIEPPKKLQSEETSIAGKETHKLIAKVGLPNCIRWVVLPARHTFLVGFCFSVLTPKLSFLLQPTPLSATFQSWPLASMKSMTICSKLC